MHVFGLVYQVSFIVLEYRPIKYDCSKQNKYYFNCNNANYYKKLITYVELFHKLSTVLRAILKILYNVSYITFSV